MQRSLLAAAAFASVVALAAACSTSGVADPASANANVSMGDGGTPMAANTPTFATDISAIVQNRCQSCHHAGGIAPFSLITYQDVIKQGALANDKIQSRDMPPWGAYDDDACTMNHAFQDDLRMTDAERTTFANWVAAGMPEGDESKAPPALTAFAANGLADKTDSFALPKPYAVAGNGGDDIRCFPIDPKLDRDTWVGAVNIVPGDARVVHHVIVYVDPKSEGPALAAKALAAGTSDGSNYPCFGGPTTSNPSVLEAWAPGVPAMSFGGSENAGVKVPKGANLVMQVHYHPTQETVMDQTAFEMKRLATLPDKVAQIILAGNAEDAQGSNTGGLITLLPGPDDPGAPAFVIPSNVKGHTEQMLLTIPATYDGFPLPPLKLGIIGAHMHWAGVDMKINIDRANPQNGEAANECLLGTPKYNFNWQRGYVYADSYDKLPTVSGGDKITISCTYDNTFGNPLIARADTLQNMNTPPTLTLGETTNDEMCLGIFVLLRPSYSLIDGN